MLAHRGVVQQFRGDLDVVAWSYYFLFSDRDRIAIVLIAQTLIFAAVAVVCTLLLFLHVFNVAIIAVGIAAIDGALFCVMYVWGVPLDASVAFICLAMAIGMSIDYVVHISHAFEHHAGSPRERAQAAVCGIGASVLKGGTSTFLGISILGAATSELFRTFFKMLVSTVFLGLFTGLAFYPAVAVWVGRFIPHKSGVEASAGPSGGGARATHDESTSSR